MDSDTDADIRLSRPARPRKAGGLLVGLAAVAAGLSACGGGVSPATGGQGTRTIVIRNFMFSPSSLTVRAGATVRVHNEDEATHTLSATDGAFTTGDIGAGQTKTFTAPAAGTYRFDCRIHQYMTGTLTVTG